MIEQHETITFSFEEKTYTADAVRFGENYGVTLLDPELHARCQEIVFVKDPRGGFSWDKDLDLELVKSVLAGLKLHI